MNYLQILFLSLMMSCTVSKTTKPITISKGLCLGTCPWFSVTLLPNGVIEFEGKEYTQVIGKTSRQLTGREQKELMLAFNNIDLNELRGTYGAIIHDLPETTLEYGDRKVVFKQSKDVPEELVAFIHTLDSMLQAKGLL